ncbi:SH3 domain-containing protein [Mycena alexandri]|uniref:SH3 domain-containing protein n=1 Tax=Mycena alexandri TaxID=1745969 RepID=A0AAD6T909_9AGAR|nr:SH3 domain-containing protein [Mycena alexandri]
MVALEQQTQTLLITPPPSTAPSYNQSQIVQAKALWAYNEGRDSSDLSFRAGDTIEIVTETNADWWTGRYNGKQGLFPSNYVEKLPPSVPSPGPPYQPPSGPQGPYSGPGGYQPPSGGYQPVYNPPSGPPQGGQYNSYDGSPPIVGKPTQASPPAAPAPQQPPKKSKFGNLGNTLAQSAVGGVGFGAGTFAVGSGIVNAIF